MLLLLAEEVSTKTNMELVPKQDFSNAPQNAFEKRWNAVFLKLSNIRKKGEDEEMIIGDGSGSTSIHVQDLKDYLRTESSYQLELDTGLPRHKLLYLAKEVESYADKNRDGKVTLKEWQEWIQNRVKSKRETGKVKKLNQFMQVMAYSPTYTCSPPTLFILSMTCLQVLFYLLR